MTCASGSRENNELEFVELTARLVIVQDARYLRLALTLSFAAWLYKMSIVYNLFFVAAGTYNDDFPQYLSSEGSSSSHQQTVPALFTRIDKYGTSL